MRRRFIPVSLLIVAGSALAGVSMPVAAAAEPDAVAWTSVFSTVSTSNYSGLNAVATPEPGSVWSVGVQGASFSTEEAVAFHTEAGVTTRYPLNVDSPFLKPSTNDVAGVSDVDLWAVGTLNAGLGSQGFIRRFDGVAWTEMTVGDDVYALTDVAVNTADDVWIAGASEAAGGGAAARGLLLHWDGTSISEVFIPRPDTSCTTRVVEDLATRGPDLLLGLYCDGTGYVRLLRGGQWSTLYAAPGAGLALAVDPTTNRLWAVHVNQVLTGVRSLGVVATLPAAQYYAIAARGRSVFIVGGSVTTKTPAIYALTGSSFTAEALATSQGQVLSGVAIDAAGQAWTVGPPTNAGFRGGAPALTVYQRIG